MKALNATHYAIELAGERLPIIIRKRSNSRRMVIRYQPREHALSLTLPRYVSIRQGLHFAEKKREWIERQLREHPRHVPFCEGQLIPVLGKNYRLKHVGGRGVVRISPSPLEGEGGVGGDTNSDPASITPHPNPPPQGGREILVPGDPEFMPRRVRDFLKQLAKDTIMPLAEVRAQQLGKSITRITIRDTTSHWGSCTHAGKLSFSWRLVLAPYEVLEYVVCHEVAHLAQHNHSPAFWRQVEILYPDYQTQRKWLKTHGQTLYVYG